MSDSPWPLHQRIAKRALDLAASTVALAVLGLPLVALGLAVRLSSRGPALFKQWRVGRGGRSFLIWKFRTMVEGAPATGPSITAMGDPRVTPLGRFLRGTKLDELPQLVNVWRGDMSLVGPRPEVPSYVAGYSANDRAVLDIRPGMTDLASIAFRDEEGVLAQFEDRERAYVEQVLPRKLELAHDYLRTQSFAADLRIILQTARVVLAKRGIPATKILARR
jgi:lipopolysaccharide/colanic/teichoic acid biosynthesis glycosyltransferase